jgi:putative intracellular protease/amidase
MQSSRPLIALALALPFLLWTAGCGPSRPGGDETVQTSTTPPPRPTAPPTPAPVPVAPPPGQTSDLTTDSATSDATGLSSSTLAPPAALAPITGPTAASLPKDRPLNAAILLVNGVYNTELTAPYDVFQHTTFHAKPGIAVFTVSPDGGPVTTAEGLRLTPGYSFQNAPAPDILVVPGATGSMDRDLQNRALIDWVRQAGGRARQVVSLGDGAFVVAQAGLLDGAAATTFGDDYKRFAQTFPRVDLRINVSFVDAGKLLTSQGGARGYDVAMHLVDKLYGPQVAKEIGHGLLIPWPLPPAIKFDTASAPPPVVPTAPPARQP